LRRRGNCVGGRDQRAAAFNFSAVHFSTSGSRSSRLRPRLSFSNFIQQSVLAFSRVIGAAGAAGTALAASEGAVVAAGASGAGWLITASACEQADNAAAMPSAKTILKRLPDRRLGIGPPILSATRAMLTTQPD
jgi:hypothetical protein